jgi:hypothetical protein
MRFRNTLILAILLVGLGAYLYFVESKHIAEEGKKEKIVELNADDVTAITLVYPDREIALEKSDAGWRLTKPVQAPADDITVKNLIRAVADAEVKKTIDEPPSDLTQFGLAQPMVVVKVIAKDTSLPDLKVGKTTSVSLSTYVQRADQAKIYLTSSAFHSGMDKQVKDLRDKKIVDFKEDDITRVALHGPEGEVVLAKADGNWKIEQPAAYRADGNAVRALLSTVRNLRATEFASDAPSDADLTTYGLDKPQRQLVLTGGDGKEIRLLVGKESDQGLYVKPGDRPTTFVVGKWAARDLAKGVNDLRDKTVLTFDPGAATAVEVVRGDGARFTMRSADGKWSIDGSDQPVDSTAIGTYVGALSRLSGSQVLSDGPSDLAPYGLAPPALTITVRGKDDVLIGTVLAGSRTPSPPTPEYTAKRADDSTVFQLHDFQFKQLDKKPADFVAKPVAPTVAAANGAGDEVEDAEEDE